MNNLDKLYQSNRGGAAFAGEYLKYLSMVLMKLNSNAIGDFSEVILDARKIGARVFFCGNGGSASTANHFANDFCIGPRDWDRPIRAVSLASNPAILTCLANDFGYESVFVKQLENSMEPGDVVVGISVSGNSQNVLEAIRYAKENGAITVGLTGFDGGELAKLVDLQIHAVTERGEYGPAEDVHMVLCHLVTAYITGRIAEEQSLSKNQKASNTDSDMITSSMARSQPDR